VSSMPRRSAPCSRFFVTAMRREPTRSANMLADPPERDSVAGDRVQLMTHRQAQLDARRYDCGPG
jgi:hypothetical protein